MRGIVSKQRSYELIPSNDIINNNNNINKKIVMTTTISQQKQRLNSYREDYGYI